MDSILSEKWFAMSLVQQMLSIGNEVKRAVRFDHDKKKKDMFLEKAILYTELSMEDPKNARIIPELCISKEVLEDYKGEHRLNCTKEQINNYYGSYMNLL